MPKGAPSFGHVQEESPSRFWFWDRLGIPQMATHIFHRGLWGIQYAYGRVWESRLALRCKIWHMDYSEKCQWEAIGEPKYRGGASTQIQRRRYLLGTRTFCAYINKIEASFYWINEIKVSFYWIKGDHASNLELNHNQRPQLQLSLPQIVTK